MLYGTCSRADRGCRRGWGVLLGGGTFGQLLRLFHALKRKRTLFKSGIDEGWVNVPAAPHAYAPGIYWTPYRRAPKGIVDERRIVGVVEENKEETRSTLYILGVTVLRHP